VDGEREILVGPDDCAEVELVQTGPFVVDVQSTLNRAAHKGTFINH